MPKYYNDEYDISKAFAAIEQELIASMMRNMDSHRAEETKEGYNWSMWQAEQLKALEKYKKQNASKFSKEFAEINGSISVLLREARSKGGTAQEQAILKAIKDGFNATKVQSSGGVEAAFFRLNTRKLDALAKATTQDFAKAEHAMLRMANDKYRKIIFNAQVYANTGAATYEKAVDMATKDFLSAGINCVEYKNGARHSLKEYSRMAIQTANKRAYLAGEGEMRQQWGISTVIMNKRGNACPKCLPFVGKILIDDVWSGGKTSDGPYQLMSTAIEAGLYHPNCKDLHTTYFPDLDEKPETKYTKKEINQIENDYQTEQKQQYAVRQTEKYDRLAKYSLDEENRKRYTARKEEWTEKNENVARHGMQEKMIKIPDSINHVKGISKNIIDEIQHGVDNITKEYDVRLSDIIIEDVSKSKPDTPYLCRYIQDKGMHKAIFVINSGFDFSDIQYIVDEGYKAGYFAGKTLEDHIIHEMAHVMTGQECKTAIEFNELAKELESLWVEGVSGYSDDVKDGFETIAEAFVRMRNHEEIPIAARKLIEKYIMRWKR